MFSVRRKLAALRRAVRLHQVAAGLAPVSMALAATVLVTLLCDWGLFALTRLPPGRAQRVAVMLLCLAGVAAVAWRALWRRLGGPLEEAELALVAEQRHPQLGGRLIAAVQLADALGQADPLARAMVRRTAAQAGALSAGLDFTAGLDRRRLARRLALALAGLALPAVLTVAAPTTMRLWLARNVLLRDDPWPQRTYLTVEGGPDLPVLRGQDLTLTVTARADSVEAPQSVTFHLSRLSGPRRDEPAPRESGAGPPRYLLRLQGLSETLSFYVTGGDARTPACRVRLVEPITIAACEVVVEFPQYTALPSRTVDVAREALRVPAGSSLTIRAATSKPPTSGRMLLDGRPTGEISVEPVSLGRPAARPGVVARLRLDEPSGPQPATIRLDLTDAEDCTTAAALRLAVEVAPDQPPTLEARWPGVGEVITPRAAIPLEAWARDDYGVTRLDAVVQPAGGAATVLPVGLAERPRRHWAVTDHRVDLEALHLRPGRTFRLSVTARDALPAHAGGPNITTGAVRELRVVTERELMGELLARRQELRQDLAEALAAQAGARDAMLAAADAADEEARAQARRGAAAQQQAASLTASVAEACRQVLGAMEANRAGADERRRRLEEQVLGPLEQLARERMPAMLADIDRAAQPAAPATAERWTALAETQEQFARQLEAVERELAAMDDVDKLARALGAIIDLGRQVPLDIHRQRLARQRWQALTARMVEAADQLDANRPREAQAIRQALRQGQEAFVAEEMEQVADLLRQGRPAEAEARQAQIIARLQAVLETLGECRDSRQAAAQPHLPADPARTSDLRQGPPPAPGSLAKPPPVGPQDPWGRLPAATREALVARFRQQVPPRYARMLDAYYRRLSERRP